MNAFEKMMQWQKYAEKVLDEDFWTDFSEVMQHKSLFKCVRGGKGSDDYHGSSRPSK
ncbi:hypothetical protein [Thalassobacillus sp. C254]|uniref:hypothetical protein n=1 Tax=Thalassobacillus sp. C254 TaxID=1225341 RepID=UPI0018DBE28A|nr:hypothetical protein [Thalassobacillus sp. C254]